MILSDNEILDRVENYSAYGLDEPMIVPFERDRLQGASYDLKINEYIYTVSHSNFPIDLAYQEQIDELYEERNITDGYELHPGEFILCTLDIILNLPKDLACHIRERTRFIRMGLQTNFQHVNPLSTTRINVGLFNASPNIIIIYPGTGIGQMVFDEITSIPMKQYKLSSGIYVQDIKFVGAKTQNEFEKHLEDEYAEMMKVLSGNEYK